MTCIISARSIHHENKRPLKKEKVPRIHNITKTRGLLRGIFSLKYCHRGFPLAIATSWKQETSPRKRRSLEFAIYRSHLHDTPNPTLCTHIPRKREVPWGAYFCQNIATEVFLSNSRYMNTLRQTEVIRKVSYIAKTIGVTFGLDFVPRNEITSTPSLLQMATTFPQRPRYPPPVDSRMNQKRPPPLSFSRGKGGIEKITWSLAEVPRLFHRYRLFHCHSEVNLYPHRSNLYLCFISSHEPLLCPLTR